MNHYDLVITHWHARFMGRIMPVALGRGGIGIKKGEGDDITPIGRYKITEWRTRWDRGWNLGQRIGLGDLWCDDPKNQAYNQPVSRPFSGSAEQMFRQDHLYDIVGVIDYNLNPIQAGAGSAIFLHCWRSPRFPTQGCVALAPTDLHWLAENWQPNSHIIIRN